MPWNKVKICSTKQECCFCCTNLSHVITGVGFPVTLANKRNVPFSGTLSSSNRSRNRGGSSLSNGNSVIETSKLVTSVSVSGFKTNTFYRKWKYLWFSSVVCYKKKECRSATETYLTLQHLLTAQHNYLKVSVSSLLKVYIDHRPEKRWFCSLLQHKFGKISQVHSTASNLIGLRCCILQKHKT